MTFQAKENCCSPTCTGHPALDQCKALPGWGRCLAPMWMDGWMDGPTRKASQFNIKLTPGIQDWSFMPDTPQATVSFM